MTQANVLAQLGSPGISTGFKNRIINGAMVIDQRNAGASLSNTTGTQYVVDRMGFEGVSSSKFTAQQSTTAPSGFTNSVVITSSAATSLGAGDYYLFRQNIEGLNVADLGWGTADAKTVTLSFWIRSSLTGTFGGSLQNSAQNRSYPFTYTISSANTWEKKSVTITGDTTGTWLTTNGKGIIVNWSLGVGTTYSGTAGSWAGAQYWSATGAGSVVGTSGATWYITGVQLEVGTSATDFEYRPYGTELQLCQRYFQTWGGTNNYEMAPVFGIGFSTNTVEGVFTFITPMRSTPTFSASGTWGWLDVAAFFSSGTLTMDSFGLQTARIRTSTSSSITQYRPYQLVANNSTAARLQLSAEL